MDAFCGAEAKEGKPEQPHHSIIARKHLQKYYSKQVKEEEGQKLKHQGNGSYKTQLCRQRRGLASDSRPKNASTAAEKFDKHRQKINENQ